MKFNCTTFKKTFITIADDTGLDGSPEVGIEIGTSARADSIVWLSHEDALALALDLIERAKGAVDHEMMAAYHATLLAESATASFNDAEGGAGPWEVTPAVNVYRDGILTTRWDIETVI